MKKRWTIFGVALVLCGGAQPGAAQSAGGTSAVRVAPAVSRGFIGIRFSHVLGSDNGRHFEHTIVTGVVDGSPADKAGVQAGDTIVKLNGRDLTYREMVEAARAAMPGEKLRLRMRRSARERDVTIVIGPPPNGPIVVSPQGRTMVLSADSLRVYTQVYLDSARARVSTTHGKAVPFEYRLVLPDSTTRAFHITEGQSIFMRADSVQVIRGVPIEGRTLRVEEMAAPRVLATMELGHRAIAGAEFLELRPELQEALGRSDGLFVVQVAPSSPAARAGLQVGDIVVTAAGQNLRTLRELRHAVAQANSGLDLQVIRKKKLVDLRLGATN